MMTQGSPRGQQGKKKQRIPENTERLLFLS